MDTFSQELFGFLENLLILTAGQNFFLYRLPSTKQVEPRVWWIVPNSQGLSQKLVTGETDYLYTYRLNYRSQSAQDVDNMISQALTLINGLQCFDLPNYSIVYCHATSANITEDLDAEDMMRGSIVITLRSVSEHYVTDIPVESDSF